MQKEMPSFTLKEGSNLEDLGAEYDLCIKPCDVCVYEDQCLGTSPEDEYFCDLAQAFEKLYDEFIEKVQNLVKNDAGIESRSLR